MKIVISDTEIRCLVARHIKGMTNIDVNPMNLIIADDSDGGYEVVAEHE